MKTQIKVLITFAAILILSFQNCGKMETRTQSNIFSENPDEHNNNGGNGSNMASCLDSVTGQTIAHNQTTTLYQNSSVTCGQSCDSSANFVRKQCYNGQLTIISGTASNASSPTCSVQTNGCTSTPTTCSEYGITANIGEVRRFYLNSTVTCGQSCDSSANYVDKRCELNGQTSQFVAITSASSPLSNYRSQNCTPPAQTSCGSGGSTPIFEQRDCVPASRNITIGIWNNIFGGSNNPWPSYGHSIRQTNSSPVLSYRFTSSNIPDQFGTFATAEYPAEGYHGTLIISISKTPGCIDTQKLPDNCVSSPWALPSIGWVNGSSPHVCNLNPGETYYLNIFWGTTEPHSSGARCPLGGEGNGICGRDMQNQRQ